MRLYAWIGEDEHGSGVVGLKQGYVPAGLIPLCAMDFDRHKLERLKPQMEEQARLYGKRIYFVAFDFAEVVDSTNNGKPAGDLESAKANEDFVRRIVAREQLDNGTGDEVTLECGHTVIRIAPNPSLDAAYCSACLHDWLEKQKESH